MAESIDRRAASGNKEKERKVDVRQDGTVRRYGGGGRAMADYFSADNRMRTVARGDLLGILEMLAWNRWMAKGALGRTLFRLAQVGRQVWSWATRQPFIPSLDHQMALSYERRTMRPTVRAVAEQAGLEVDDVGPED